MVTSAPVTSEVPGSILGRIRVTYVIEQEGDSLRQRRFPPGASVSSYIPLQFAYMLSIKEPIMNIVAHVLLTQSIKKTTKHKTFFLVTLKTYHLLYRPMWKASFISLYPCKA